MALAATPEEITLDQIQVVKEDEFLPAMSRLTHLGLLLLKYTAPVSYFRKVSDQLFEILLASRSLQIRMARESREQVPASLAEHNTYSVPAVESLLTAHLLAGYSLKRMKRINYAATLFPRVAEYGSLGEVRESAFISIGPTTGKAHRSAILTFLGKSGSERIPVFCVYWRAWGRFRT